MKIKPHTIHVDPTRDDTRSLTVRAEDGTQVILVLDGAQADYLVHRLGGKLDHAPRYAPADPVKTITRAEYDRSKPHEYAGTARTLEPQTRANFAESYPDWQRMHWYMDAGPVLVPVNVV